jgi:hypothetical protein
VGEGQIMRLRESLVLYKSFNTLWEDGAGYSASPGTGELEADLPRVSMFKKMREKNFITIRFTLTHFSLRQNSPLKNELNYNLEKHSHVVFVMNYLAIEIT